MVRMKDEKLPKRSETKEQGDCRNRGRPQLRLSVLQATPHDYVDLSVTTAHSNSVVRDILNT